MCDNQYIWIKLSQTTGKTTLLRQQFSKACWIDLLDYDLFLEEQKCKKAFIVAREPLPRKLTSKITVLPWQVFCGMLWAGEII